MGYDPNCGYNTEWRKMEAILQKREEASYITFSGYVSIYKSLSQLFLSSFIDISIQLPNIYGLIFLSCNSVHM